MTKARSSSDPTFSATTTHDDTGIVDIKLNGSASVENGNDHVQKPSLVRTSTGECRFVVPPLAAPGADASPYIPLSQGICDTALDAIGDTPLVKLNKIPQEAGLTCDVLAKCEFFNAGGSVKDRIGKRMVEDAEQAGRITPGDTLIEPTSGNTGIGIALAAAIKGYRCIIVLPEKMSKEKVDVLKALGAEIVRTPTEAAYDAPDSHISVARRLNSEIPNSHILDQYRNVSNPLAHYEGTAEELIRQCESDGRTIDMIVAGAGTGGTITGLAKRMRQHNPNVIVVGVDPVGSILAIPDSMNDESRLEPYQVEGIGYDFIPDVLDRSLVDKWVKTRDKDSLIMMRRLIREEGLLCGGSCGAAVTAALEAGKVLKEGQTCIVILPDSVRNYMTKALSDDWMVDRGFVDNKTIVPKDFKGSWWADKKVKDLKLNSPLTITSDVTCKDAIALLKQEGFDMVPVIGENGDVIGVVTEGNMTSMILSGRARPNCTVMDARVIYKTFHTFSMEDSLEGLARALDLEPYALVVTAQRCFTGKRKGEEGKVSYRSVVSGIVTRIDLLDFVSSGAAFPNDVSVKG